MTTSERPQAWDSWASLLALHTTAHRDETIRKAREAGMPVERIAAAVKLSPSQVWRIVQERG